MGQQLGPLVVSLEANMAKFTSNMDQAAKQTDSAMKRIDASSATAQRAMQRLDSSVGMVKASVAGIAGVVSIGAFKSLSDSASTIEGKIRLVTESYEEMKAVQAELLGVSQQTRQSFESTADLYAKVYRASEDLNLSQEQLVQFTATVNNAMVVSAAGAQQSEAAILQLGQAIASGKLAGDEFKSIAENSPRLVQAIADGMGVARGEMKQLAADGKLTSEVIAQAVISQFGAVQAEAAQMPVTIGQSMQQLRNVMVDYMTSVNESSGITQTVASAVALFSRNIDTLEAGVAGLVSYKLTAWTVEIATALIGKANAAYAAAGALSTERFATIAAAEADVAKAAAEVKAVQAQMATVAASRADAIATLASANATAAATAAIGAHSVALAMNKKALHARSLAIGELAALGRAQAAAEAAMTAATTRATAAATSLTAAKTAGAGAASLAGRALGLLGGPIGLVSTALSVGVTAWMLWGDAANDAETTASEAVEASTEQILTDLDEQIKKLRERNGLASAGMADLARSESPEAAKMASLKARMSAADAGTGEFAGLSKEARNDIIAKLGVQYGTLYARIQAANTEKAKLDSAGQTSKVGEWLSKYATQAEKLNAELAKAKQELGKDFTPELEQRIRAQFAPAPNRNGDAKKTGKTAAQIKLEEDIKAWTEEENRVAEAYRAENERALEAESRAIAENEREVEYIRQSLLSQAQAEDEAHATRLESLRSYHDAKYENVAEANALIEAENARHAQAKADMQASYEMQSLAMAGGMADDMYSLLKQAGQEQTAIGKAVFLASKAIAVAEIIMQTNVAAAKAEGQLGIFGLPLSSIILATGYARAGMVAGLAIADASAEGGYDIPAGVNPMTQLHEREMVLPQKHADVIRDFADNSGGRGGMKLTIVNNTSVPIGRVTEQQIGPNERALIIEEAAIQAVNVVAAQMGDPNSKTSRAMSRNFNTPRTR